MKNELLVVNLIIFGAASILAIFAVIDLIKNWHMIEKVLLGSQRDFDEHCRKYWCDGDYVKYYVTKPKSFPCVAIVVALEVDGWGGFQSLGSKYEVTEYVYLSDFEDKSYWQI